MHVDWCTSRYYTSVGHGLYVSVPCQVDEVPVSLPLPATECIRLVSTSVACFHVFVGARGGLAPFMLTLLSILHFPFSSSKAHLSAFCSSVLVFQSAITTGNNKRTLCERTSCSSVSCPLSPPPLQRYHAFTAVQY